MSVWALGLVLAGIAIRRGLRAALIRASRPPHRPAGASPAALGLEAEDVTIRGAAGRLRAWLVPASGPGPRPAALVLHGWSGNASSMLAAAAPLHAAGLHVLLLDAMGHGRSDDAGFSSMPGFADNAERALRRLRADPRVDPARVALVGHSVGAGACLLVAARDPSIAAVVSISSMADPAAHMDRAMRRRGMPRLARRIVLHEIESAMGIRFAEFAPTATISQLRAPVLLVHGAADSVVPVADAQALRRAAPPGTDLLVIPDADHAAMDRLLLAAPAVVDFLRAALSSEALDGRLPGT